MEIKRLESVTGQSEEHGMEPAKQPLIALPFARECPIFKYQHTTAYAFHTTG